MSKLQFSHSNTLKSISKYHLANNAMLTDTDEKTNPGNNETGA